MGWATLKKLFGVGGHPRTGRFVAPTFALDVEPGFVAAARLSPSPKRLQSVGVRELPAGVPSYRFPSKQPRLPHESKGIALIIVMMIVTLLLVALTASLPSVYQEGRREREAELLFRGNQYARAVAMFHRQFNRYPVNIKELMGTNNIKFLRREYRDPMDREGKWRFVHANAMGMLIDSKNQPLPANLANPNNPSGTSSAFGSSQTGQQSALGGMGQSGFQSGSGSASAFGSSQTGQQSASGGMGQSGFQSGSGSGSSQSSSSFFGSGNDVQGAFIVGVAPTSHGKPIRNCSKKQHYDEWEFVGVDLGVFGIQGGVSCFTTFWQGMGQQPQAPSVPTNPLGGSSPGVGGAIPPPGAGTLPN